MGDFEGLETDPRFQALPPEKQRALLAEAQSRAGGGAAGGGLLQQAVNLPSQAASYYRQNIAPPLTNMAAHAVAHPLEAISDPMAAMQHTKPEHLPPYAREVAENVVPQTGTGLALTAASMLLPGAGVAREVGEAAGPIGRLMSGVVGRTAAGAALGAGAGALTGEGAGQGAEQGAVSFGVPTAVGALIGHVGRSFGEPGLIRDTTQKVGQELEQQFPLVGKLRTGSDFANAFMRDGARNAARLNLSKVKEGIGKKVAGRAFQMPVPDPPGLVPKAQLGALYPKSPLPGTRWVKMSFDAADKLRRDLQQGYGYSAAGGERAGALAREMRQLSFHARDVLAKQLDRHQGGLGQAYLDGLKHYHVAASLSEVFGKEGLFSGQGLNQPEFIGRINKEYEKLEGALGKAGTDRLLSTLKRGFIGEDVDIPSKPGHGHLMMHAGIIPTYHRSMGESFKPIGKVPWSMRPKMGAVEATAGRALGERLVKDRREGNTVPNPHPKPEAAKGLVTKDAREIHSDLRGGRLSHRDMLAELKGIHDYKQAPLGDQLKQQDLKGLLAKAEDPKMEVSNRDLPVFYQALVRKYQQGAASGKLSRPVEKRYQRVLENLRPRLRQLSQGAVAEA